MLTLPQVIYKPHCQMKIALLHRSLTNLDRPIGGVHKLSLQELAFFEPLTPSIYIFYVIKVYKKLIFLTTYPPHCEWPHIILLPSEEFLKGGYVFRIEQA